MALKLRGFEIVCDVIDSCVCVCVHINFFTFISVLEYAPLVVSQATVTSKDNLASSRNTMQLAFTGFCYC